MTIAQSYLKQATGESVVGIDAAPAKKKKIKPEGQKEIDTLPTRAHEENQGERLLIHEDDRNYRQHDQRNLDLIGKSLDDLGCGRSIVADASGAVIGGNGTLRMANQRGIPIRQIETDGNELICVVRKDLKHDDPRRAQLAIMDNSTTDSSTFDYELMQEDFSIEDLEELGVEVPEVEIMEEEEAVTGETEPDAVPEVEEEPVSVLGKVYQLGKHRLMCGDSTSAEDVAKLMQSEKADMVFTDPPYGMKKEAEGVANDNLNFDDLLEFNKKWIPLTFEALKDNGSWYCWGIDEPLMDIYSHILKPMAKRNEITFRNLITWDKGDAGAGGVSFMGKEGLRSFPVSDEKCLFVMCGVQGFNNNADHYDETFEPIRAYMEREAKKVNLKSSQLKEICGVGMYSHWFTKSQFAIIPQEHYEKLQSYFNGVAFTLAYNDLKSLFDDEKHQTLKEAVMAKRAYFDNTHDKMKTVWEFGRVKGKEREDTGGHATPKPIALCARGIKSSSREGEIVLDVFGGSGSTLIACEQLNRRCRIMELTPYYCDVIRRRWAEFKYGEGCDWQALTPEV